MKNLKLLCVLVFCASLMLACEQESKDEFVVEGDNTVSTWADDLTVPQIIQTMPITAEAINLNETQVAQAKSLMKRNLTDDVATEEDGEIMAVRVEWTVPKSSICPGCTLPSSWNLFEQNDAEDWVPVEDVSLTAVDNKYLDGTVTYYYDYYFYLKANNTYCHYSWGGKRCYTQYYLNWQAVKYFKVEMQDHNTGATYDNIVTFMVCPSKNPIEIKLVEASADAHSQLFVEYGYDLASEELFYNNDGSLQELTLPQNESLKTETLPPNSPVKFTIRTDFSGWGFDDDIVIHQSNSSFCKVQRITEGLPADVAWRFEYRFEDLPLSKKAIEANGLFDYNDLWFYVDVMKL